MCGIAGLMYFDEQKPSLAVLENMTRSMEHRGPDDSGIWIEKQIGLGFRRLSIIDLEDGGQPLSNENESIWIVFNGEIYNYKTLREDLIQRGHRFKTESDTEVIVHLYEEYGDDRVHHLRGMFAFAIWDCNRKRLFAARDYFGIKPFYYALTENVSCSPLKSRAFCIGNGRCTTEHRVIVSLFDVPVYSGPGHDV